MRSAFMARSSLSLLLGILLAGCPGPGPLDGSLADILDLDYTRSTLDLAGTSLSLRFQKPRGEEWDTVLKVAADLGGLTLSSKPIDLAEVLPSGAQRGSVTRNVYKDEHTVLPPLQRGTMTLKADPTAATTIEGELFLTFVVGSDFGCGRSVSGKFAAEVVKP
jgi:hypothetical protein